MEPFRAGLRSGSWPESAASTPSRLTQRASSSSAGSREISRASASPRQPIIRLEGKGQGWLER